MSIEKRFETDRSEASFSIHLYTGFGPRDRTEVEKEYGRTVYGPDAAEFSIEIAKGLINKAVSTTLVKTNTQTYRERSRSALQRRSPNRSLLRSMSMVYGTIP